LFERIIPVLFLLMLIPFTIFPLKIFLNGNFYSEFSSRWLTENSYSIPIFIDGKFRISRGVSLLEISPLMYYVDSIVISNGEDELKLVKDGLENELRNIFIVESNGKWWIMMDGKFLLENPEKIFIEGEAIEGGELEIWLDWEGVDYLKEEIKRFEELHENVKIKSVFVPKTSGKLLTVYRGRGKIPDIVMVQADQIYRLKSFRLIQNLDYIFSTMKDSFIDKAGQAFELDGKIWAIPFYLDTQLVFYNPDLFEKYDVPLPNEDWTLDNLVEIARKFKESGFTGVGWNAYSVYWFIPFQIGFGKEKLVEDGRMDIVDDPTISALEFINDLRKSKLLCVLERDAMISKFVDGKLAMILSGSFMVPEFMRLNLNFKVAHYPFNSKTGKYVSPLLDFKGFAITRKTKNPVLARRLIEHLTGIGVQSRFCEKIHKLPVERHVFEMLKEKDEMFRMAFRSVEIGTLIPTEPVYRIYKSTMWNLLRLVFTDKLDPRSALIKGQRIIDANLEDKIRGR